MTKKNQTQKADIVLKSYWRENEPFADFFNAVLFGGRAVIKPEELEELDTEESSVLEHRSYAEGIKAARDSIKIRKRSVALDTELIMLAMENQEHIHYAMPLRVMGYDYGAYKKQYDSNARRYKTAKGMSADEYLSRMKRSDRFVPVITIVVYYGEKAWDGAKSLYEMLKIPEEIVPYVNDYKMVLVEARRSGLKLHNSKNIDLFRLLEILLDQSCPPSETRKRAIEYTREKQVDRSVILAVAGAVNCKMDYTELTKEGADMCKVFEMTWAEGKAEGRVEGRAEGRVEGRAEGRAEGRVEGKAEGRAEGIAEGIRALILDNLEEGTSRERIILKLQKRFSLKEAEALKYIKRFASS